MSKCSACEDLRNDAPNFVVNGVDNEVCTSLKNGTGFNPNLTPPNDNCTDLDNANECLVGNMADQIEAYDTCEWKEYMEKLVPNIYTVIKAMICSDCGLWTIVDCIRGASGHFDTDRTYTEIDDIYYYTSHFSPIGGNNTKAVVSYSNFHVYQRFDIKSSIRSYLAGRDTYLTDNQGNTFTDIYGIAITGIPVFSCTGRWDTHDIRRIEQANGVTSSGSFVWQSNVHHNPNDYDEVTVTITLRSKITDTYVDEYEDSIMVNLPCNINLGMGSC